MKNLLIIIILSFLCLEILTERESILSSVSFSLSIWKDNIFPSLFPFFVLTGIMIKYGISEFIGTLLKPLMNKLFRIKGSSAFILIMSTLSGNPSNAKYIREFYLNKEIDVYEATKILCFSCFSNPLFILGTVSIMFLNNKKIGFLILFCHYIGNVIIGLFLRNYHPSKEEGKATIKEALKNMGNKQRKNNQSFGDILTESILNSINTLLLILGILTICLVLTTIIDNNIKLNSVYQSVLNGFIEMTQGLKYISTEDLPLKIKSVLSVMILSFGGLSVHIQIMSILNDTDIKYLPFLIARCFHALISGMLMFILFDFWFST